MSRPDTWESVTTNGFYVFRLSGDAVYRLRARLTFGIGMLNDYSDLNSSHDDIEKRIHDIGEWQEILEENESIIKPIIGHDICHRSKPVIIIMRPKSTSPLYYGGSINDWVLSVPLTDDTEEIELTILNNKISRKFGEAVLFNCAMVGNIKNISKFTSVSVDILISDDR